MARWYSLDLVMFCFGLIGWLVAWLVDWLNEWLNEWMLSFGVDILGREGGPPLALSPSRRNRLD